MEKLLTKLSYVVSYVFCPLKFWVVVKDTGLTGKMIQYILNVINVIGSPLNHMSSKWRGKCRQIGI